MISLILLILFNAFGSGNIVIAYFDITVPDYKNVFDLNLYESVLDPELCEEQIRYIQQNDQELLFEFLDAGIRIPRGILVGNLLDLGNYYQCLDINKPISNSVAEGKYCMIELPLNQSWPSLPSLPEWPDFPDIPWPEWNSKKVELKDEIARSLANYNAFTEGFSRFNGATRKVNRISQESPLAQLTMNLAVCIPKPCSPQTALNSLFNNSEFRLIDFEESFCRLPNDKPWVAGDFVALSIFSFIGILVVMSTAYDIRHNVYGQTADAKKPKEINKLYLAFSVYTNTRRLVTYTPIPGALECIDGIRALAMVWVILGHTFITKTASGILANPLDSLAFMTSLGSVWVTAAPITVDTFFTLSGLLLVYTSAGKLTGMKLLKNLHLFYLNRLLRMFPVLAAMILIQVSLLSRVADGPFWAVAMEQAHTCRVYWWSTLLYLQNYLNPDHICLYHTWYLAVDIQLHILSPIVLFWVLSGKRQVAWSVLVGALIAILAASTTFNFIMDFQSGPVIPSRPEDDAANYMSKYYVNTLTRASPFFVGLIFGYILHLNRGKKVVLSSISVVFLWVAAITILLLTIYSSYPIMQLDWDNQFADNMINSFMRPAWAMVIGWLIFACHHGYGGPVNWLLSLQTWKVLGRLSYAMYIVHYPMMFVTNAMPVAPVYFSVPLTMYRFFADFALAVFVAFLMTILIDSPCTVLIKHFMGPGPKRPPPKAVDKEKIEDKKVDVYRL